MNYCGVHERSLRRFREIWTAFRFDVVAKFGRLSASALPRICTAFRFDAAAYLYGFPRNAVAYLHGFPLNAVAYLHGAFGAA